MKTRKPTSDTSETEIGQPHASAVDPAPGRDVAAKSDKAHAPAGKSDEHRAVVVKPERPHAPEEAEESDQPRDRAAVSEGIRAPDPQSDTRTPDPQSDDARVEAANAEKIRAHENELAAANVRIAGRRGQPGSEPRPGDIGYAPPSRIAPPVGVLTNDHLGYHEASPSPDAVPPLAVPVQVPVGDEAKPSRQSRETATVNFAKMIGDMQAFVLDNPHRITGPAAVYAQFFRDMAARQAAQDMAQKLGRTEKTDDIDEAESTPPQEYHALRDLAQQMKTMQKAYEKALKNAGAELDRPSRTMVDGIAAQFNHLLDS